MLKSLISASLQAISLLVFFPSLGLAGHGQFQDIIPSIQLSRENPTQARSALLAMGVSYLWLMDGSDVSSDPNQFQVNDFIRNTPAMSPLNAGVSLQACRDSQFVQIERPRPDAPIGGFLNVREALPLSKIKSQEAFTVGAWIKLQPTTPVPKHTDTDPSYMPRGFMPLLARTAPGSTSQRGGDEWIVQMTSEITYLNINRIDHGQNDSNQKVPWWADTYGTCYNTTTGPMGTEYHHDECWHFVMVSYNPVSHESKFLMVRRQGNNMPGFSEDFSQTIITTAQDDARAVGEIPNSGLVIGGNGGSGMHGIIRGLFFARKALSFEEAKSIANFTQPSKSAVLCNARDLQKIK